MRDMDEHVTQSDVWADFKSKMGNKPIKVGDLYITKHKIPLIPYYVGYAPRVNFIKQNFGWTELKTIAKQEKIAFIRFDVPNISKDEIKKGSVSKKIEQVNSNCKKSPRSTFAKWNVLMDLSGTEQEVAGKFSQKTRYNIKLAFKKGAIVKVENNENGLNIFLKLLHETAKRQKYFTHPDTYYKKLFDVLNKKGMVHILVCYYENEPLASWMLFNYKQTLYYPYGGSSEDHRNIMASNLIAWEAIRLGKSLNCEIFDMWGATNDKEHEWWGFTRFKLGYGGELVEYINSYDFIVNKVIYFVFNFTYSIFWKLVSLIRRSN